MNNCLKDFLSYENKIIISCLVGAYWIYFRKLENYKLLPRQNLLSVVLVVLWIYFNYKEPLLLPIGLILMYFYSKYKKNLPFSL